MLVRARRRPLVLALLGCLGFCALSLLLLRSEPLVAVAGLGFFGVVGVPVLLWRLVGGGPAVRVVPDHLGIGRTRVPWGDVAGAGVVEGRPPFVVVHLTPSGWQRLQAGGGSRALLRGANAAALPGERALALPAGLEVPPHELAAVVAERAARAR